jgi:hypothetical protein
MQTTYRVIALADRTQTGGTAADPELAKLAAGDLDRSLRLGIEQTDWSENFDKWKAQRTILIDAETAPGQWRLGP